MDGVEKQRFLNVRRKESEAAYLAHARSRQAVLAGDLRVALSTNGGTQAPPSQRITEHPLRKAEVSL